MWQGGGERFRFEGPRELCARYVRPARVLVERTREMFTINSESGADAATRTYRYDSGAWVRVTVFVNSPPIITINVEGVKAGRGKKGIVSTDFWFHCDGAQLGWGQKYLPGDVQAAYNQEEDAGGMFEEPGKWVTRELPIEKNWLQTYSSRFFSRDRRRVDDYPRWVTQWESSYYLEPRRFATYPTWNSTYYINGKVVEAPGGVIGAIKEADRDVVFTTNNSYNPVTITRYDRGEEGEWAATWTSEVPLAGNADSLTGIASSMHISPAGAKAMFCAAAVFNAVTSTNPSDFRMFLLYEIDLSTGVITFIYGNADDILRQKIFALVEAVDGDAPDNCPYRLETNEPIETGVTTTAQIRPLNNSTAWRIMPRVGDNFHFGISDPNTVISSRIEVTSVTYTPRPYSVSGQVFSGTIYGHESQAATITFTWVKAGHVVGGDPSDTITYPVGTQLFYICAGDPVETNYYKEETQEFTNHAITPIYGYESNETAFYAVCKCEYSSTETETVVGGVGSLSDDTVYSDTGYTWLEFVGGSRNGRIVIWGDQAFDYTYSIDIVNFSPGVDDDTFSGMDFLTATGSVGPDSYREIFYPTSVPYGAGGAAYVNGAVSDDASISQGGHYDQYADSLCRQDYGFVYDLENILASGAIDQRQFRTNLTLFGYRYTGAAGPEIYDYPYKDINVESVDHRGVEKSKYLAVDIYDFGGSGNTGSSAYTLDGRYSFAAESYNAAAGLRDYRATSGALADYFVSYENIVSDPFGNVIYLFERGYSGSTIRQGDYGFLWRERDGYTDTDPRQMFAAVGAVLPESYPGEVHWGAIVSELTLEDMDDEAGSEQEIVWSRTYDATYRQQP